MGQAKSKGGESKQDNKLVKDMEPIIEKVYKADIQDKEVSSQDLYHAIFKIIQKLREKHGAPLQYTLPDKDELERVFKKHKSSSGHLTQEECEKIMKELIKPENFSTGNNAIKILLCLYGFPICALFAKRMIPAMKSISDDVVIPAATSASVAFLCTTHKL